jgi:hypothetical protein
LVAWEGNLTYYRTDRAEGLGLRAEGLGLSLSPEPEPFSISIRYKWLISDAIEAAPNPLSMFTTETPDAQLFSMPSRAAMPPKLAP